MRLIDADELTFDRLTDSICQGQAEDVVAEAPTIDAVPVVRCRECKYRYMDKSVWLCVYGLMIKPNSFCNYGERREDEGTTE